MRFHEHIIWVKATDNSSLSSKVINLLKTRLWLPGYINSKVSFVSAEREWERDYKQINCGKSINFNSIEF